MAKFEVNVVGERDVDELLTRAGVFWREDRPFVNEMIRGGVGLAIFAVTMGLIWAALGRDWNVLLTVGFVATPGFLWLYSNYPGRERALYLHDDGLMETPHGTFYWPRRKAIAGHHRDIVSIETRPQTNYAAEGMKLFELVVISRGGDLTYLSRNLPEWVALKVAAQLTIALEKLRREEANNASTTYQGWTNQNDKRGQAA